MSKYHEVVSGDSIASLAKQYGFVASQLWEHPNNKQLAEERGNPNTLLAGDQVFIPDLQPDEVSIDTEKLHRYRRLGIPSKITFQVLEFGKPLAGLAYTITLDDDTIIVGATDDDGFIRESVQPERTSAVVEYEGRFGLKKKTVRLGHLDPVTEVLGVQQRLNNIGMKVAPSGVVDDATRDALIKFQRKHSLDTHGELDDATRSKLVEVCGS